MVLIETHDNRFHPKLDIYIQNYLKPRAFKEPRQSVSLQDMARELARMGIIQSADNPAIQRELARRLRAKGYSLERTRTRRRWVLSGKGQKSSKIACDASAPELSGRAKAQNPIKTLF